MIRAYFQLFSLKYDGEIPIYIFLVSISLMLQQQQHEKKIEEVGSQMTPQLTRMFYVFCNFSIRWPRSYNAFVSKVSYIRWITWGSGWSHYVTSRTFFNVRNSNFISPKFYNFILYGPLQHFSKLTKNMRANADTNGFSNFLRLPYCTFYNGRFLRDSARIINRWNCGEANVAYAGGGKVHRHHAFCR